MPSHFSYDAELHLVHYNSAYDNISHAVWEGLPNGLSVVGILIKEVGEFDQFKAVKDSQSITNLKMAALELARPQTGPGPAKTDLTVRAGEFITAIRYTKYLPEGTNTLQGTLVKITTQFVRDTFWKLLFSIARCP